MSAPINVDAAHAQVIVGANAECGPGKTLVQEGFDNISTVIPPTTYGTTLWFVRTALVSEVTFRWAMSTSDASVYQPQVTIYTGTPSALVQYLDFVDLSYTSALNVPMTAGTTYYFKVTNALGNTPIVDQFITLSLLLTYGPGLPAPVGAIIITDFVPGFPAALVDSTGTVPIQQHVNLPSGEAGAVLPDGTIMVENAATHHPEIYGPTLQLITVVSGITISSMRLSSDRNVTFFVAAPDGSIVYKVSKTGTISGTTYGPLAASVATFGVAHDQSVLYYTVGTIGSAIKKWTLATNLAAADLAAAVALYAPHDLVVMADTSIVVTYENGGLTSSTTKLYQYSAAGATTHTYTLNTAPLNHLIQAIDDPASVWVWMGSQLGPTTTFENVRLSDGVILKTLTLPVQSDGVMATSGCFGVSTSCPLLILGPYNGGTTPPGGGIVGVGGLPGRAVLPALPGAGSTDPIRVQRRFLLPSETNLQMFLSRLELLAQMGVGLTAGPSGSPVQGEDPQVMLRLSRDGGRTWGNEIWRSLGALGNYTNRAVWNRLGRGRQLVVELTISDPVFVGWLDAFATLEQGTS